MAAGTSLVLSLFLLDIRNKCESKGLPVGWSRMDSRIRSDTLSLMVFVPLNATPAFTWDLYSLPAFSLRGSLPLSFVSCNRSSRAAVFIPLFFSFSFSASEAAQLAEGVCSQTALVQLEVKQAPVNTPSSHPLQSDPSLLSTTGLSGE